MSSIIQRSIVCRFWRATPKRMTGRPWFSRLELMEFTPEPDMTDHLEDISTYEQSRRVLEWGFLVLRPVARSLTTRLVVTFTFCTIIQFSGQSRYSTKKKKYSFEAVCFSFWMMFSLLFYVSMYSIDIYNGKFNSKNFRTRRDYSYIFLINDCGQKMAFDHIFVIKTL